MEKEVGAVLVNVAQRLTDIPGQTLAIIVEQDIEILPDVANLGQGFVPEGLQHGLGLRSVLTIAKQVGAGLRFDRFDIDTRDNVREERNLLLHVGPDFIDQ